MYEIRPVKTLLDARSRRHGINYLLGMGPLLVILAFAAVTTTLAFALSRWVARP